MRTRTLSFYTYLIADYIYAQENLPHKELDVQAATEAQSRIRPGASCSSRIAVS